jgi:hypothetical protein
LVLSALLLFCCNALPVGTPRIPAMPTTVETNTATPSDHEAELLGAKPDSPAPKTVGNTASRTNLEVASPGEAAIEPAFNSSVKPVTAESYETPAERKAWYGLLILGHGAAAFDAWTTRRVIGGGYGVEADPLQRPFAHSGAIYATTQLTPLIMDFVGHRMMRSSHPLLRKAWWLPQAASAGVSLSAGIHNYGIAP